MTASRTDDAAGRGTFEDALGQLLADYCATPIDDLISALELQLDALREQRAQESGDG
jgi:hypothetical protein